MEHIWLKKNSVKKIEKGLTLIQQSDLFRDTQPTQDWVEFREAKSDRFVGKGYLGEQNKGIGWVLTRDSKTALDLTFFKNIFQQAFRARAALFQSEATNAFRLFNGEGDGIGGLTIDYYAGYVVFSWYNETLYQNSQLIYQAFAATVDFCKGIYAKIRFTSYKSQLPITQHISGEKAPEPLLIIENGVRYATYLNEGLMTGIFLDQRPLRGRLAEGLAAGLTVLNTFSYTGAFSVAAAMGGATKTVSVDLAKRSLEKTKEQFQLNQLDLATNQIVVMDVFDYFRYAARKKLTFDIIILDPPSFARNKKQHFSVQQDYGSLVTAVLPLLNSEGLLIASCNAANLSTEKYERMIDSAIQQAGAKSHLIEKFELSPEDFPTLAAYPESNYLKILALHIQK